MKKNIPHRVEVNTKILLQLIHWARRYCDRRMTFAPNTFNTYYGELLEKYPFIAELDEVDKTLMHDGIYFPNAQDGQYNPVNGNFDARDKVKAFMRENESVLRKVSEVVEHTYIDPLVRENQKEQ